MMDNAYEYKEYLRIFPEGKYAHQAKIYYDSLQTLLWDRVLSENSISAYIEYLSIYPEGIYKTEAEIRKQIIDFQSGFKLASTFNENLINIFKERLSNETYSINIGKDLEYYIVSGEPRITPSKRKVIVRASPELKGCSLNIEVGNLSVEALYIDSNTQTHIDRPLFASKWEPTMSHTGWAGPGLEIKMISTTQWEQLKYWLDKYNIFYRIVHCTDRRNCGFVIPDLVRKSDKDGRDYGDYTHYGHDFYLNTNDILFKVDSVVGIPNAPVRTYKEALALKTFLSIANENL